MYESRKNTSPYPDTPLDQSLSLKSGGGDSRHCVNPERIPPPTPLKPPGAAIAKWGRRAFRTGTEIFSKLSNKKVQKRSRRTTTPASRGGSRGPRLEAGSRAHLVVV